MCVTTQAKIKRFHCIPFVCVSVSVSVCVSVSVSVCVCVCVFAYVWIPHTLLAYCARLLSMRLPSCPPPPPPHPPTLILFIPHLSSPPPLHSFSVTLPQSISRLLRHLDIWDRRPACSDRKEKS
ncbi:unnamed protein product [Gadus morhua 'NCC']